MDNIAKFKQTRQQDSSPIQPESYVLKLSVSKSPRELELICWKLWRFNGPSWDRSGSLWGLQKEILLNILSPREFEMPPYIAFILESPSKITTIVSDSTSSILWGRAAPGPHCGPWAVWSYDDAGPQPWHRWTHKKKWSWANYASGGGPQECRGKRQTTGKTGI